MVLALPQNWSSQDVREHKRWMLKWLHPDRNPSAWEANLFHRVKEASDRIENGTAKDSADPAAAVAFGRAETGATAALPDNMAARPSAGGLRHYKLRKRDIVKLLIMPFVLAVCVTALASFTWLRWARREVCDAATFPSPVAPRQRYALLAATACGVVIAASMGLPSVWRLPPQNPVPAALSGQGIADYLNGLDAPGIRRLEDYAFTLLHQNALDAEALQYLVVAGRLKKDTQRQEVLALNAARYTMRDSRTQLTAVNIALQKKQYDDAFHLDGLLRARPDLGQQFYATLAALISSNDALPALTKVLAASPPWRRNLLSFLARHSKAGR